MVPATAKLVTNGTPRTWHLARYWKTILDATVLIVTVLETAPPHVSTKPVRNGLQQVSFAAPSKNSTSARVQDVLPVVSKGAPTPLLATTMKLPPLMTILACTSTIVGTVVEVVLAATAPRALNLHGAMMELVTTATTIVRVVGTKAIAVVLTTLTSIVRNVSASILMSPTVAATVVRASFRATDTVTTITTTAVVIGTVAIVAERTKTTISAKCACVRTLTSLLLQQPLYWDVAARVVKLPVPRKHGKEMATAMTTTTTAVAHGTAVTVAELTTTTTTVQTVTAWIVTLRELGMTASMSL